VGLDPLTSLLALKPWSENNVMVSMFTPEMMIFEVCTFGLWLLVGLSVGCSSRARFPMKIVGRIQTFRQLLTEAIDHAAMTRLQVRCREGKGLVLLINAGVVTLFNHLILIVFISGKFFESKAMPSERP
jgi:hypothetical protein